MACMKIRKNLHPQFSNFVPIWHSLEIYFIEIQVGTNIKTFNYFFFSMVVTLLENLVICNQSLCNWHATSCCLQLSQSCL